MAPFFLTEDDIWKPAQLPIPGWLGWAGEPTPWPGQFSSFARRRVRVEPIARCALRTDLPKPESLALECRDWAGKYVGTLRARKPRELRDRLWIYLKENSRPPGCCNAFDAAPLHEYRFVAVYDNGAGSGAAYVSDLLRADGFWQVVGSEAMVPSGETDRLLRCSVNTRFAGAYWGSTGATLSMENSAGRHVATARGWSGWGARRSVQDAVQSLIEMRQLDEAVHRPLPLTAGRPPNTPCP
jgi:hypothetical protein